jgi:ankyrin repeat protein
MATNDHVDAIKALKEAGANVMAKGGDESLTEKYIMQRVTEYTRKGYTPLHYAAENGDLEVVTWMLKTGSEVSPFDSNGRTPLHSAADCGQLDIVKVLISAGSNVSSSGNQGETPLHLAALKGSCFHM